MEVKVWNDNSHPYTEEFKGQKIEIPAGKFVKMEKEEAILFLGQFNSITRDVHGNPSPKSYKRLRVEEISSNDKAKG